MYTSSAVFIVYNATGLSERGNEYVKTGMESQFSARMTWLEELIKYYLATGTMKRTCNSAVDIADGAI